MPHQTPTVTVEIPAYVVEARAANELFQKHWRAGLWLELHEAAKVAGVSRARLYKVQQSKRRLTPLWMGSTYYFAISELADRWPTGPGVLEWKAGPEFYTAWRQHNLFRPLEIA